MNNNNSKYLIQSIAYSTALLMIAGSVIQAFLLENGLSERMVTSYLSVVQIVQVSVMLVVSLVIDRIKNILRVFAWAMVLQLGLFLSLIFLCIFSGVDITLKYVLVFSTGIITNVIQAIYNIVCYKAPYHIIDMTHFAKITGKLGVITGITGIVVSAVMSFMTGAMDYNTAMLCFFVFGSVCMLASFFLTLSYKPVIPKTHHSHGETKKVSLLKYRPFYILIFPNLARGFCTGILSVSMTIGFSVGITNKSSGAVLTLILQIATVVSCFIYTFIAKKNNDGIIILIASALLSLSMPAMLIGRSLALFYVMYFLANFFISFINNSVPVAVTKFVDYEYIGQYSSWRMLLHTSGVALSNALVTPLFSALGGVGLMIFAVTLQLFSGVSYYLFLKKCNFY